MLFSDQAAREFWGHEYTSFALTGLQADGINATASSSRFAWLGMLVSDSKYAHFANTVYEGIRKAFSTSGVPIVEGLEEPAALVREISRHGFNDRERRQRLKCFVHAFVRSDQKTGGFCFDQNNFSFSLEALIGIALSHSKKAKGSGGYWLVLAFKAPNFDEAGRSGRFSNQYSVELPVIQDDSATLDLFRMAHGLARFFRVPFDCEVGMDC